MTPVDPPPSGCLIRLLTAPVFAVLLARRGVFRAWRWLTKRGKK